MAKRGRKKITNADRRAEINRRYEHVVQMINETIESVTGKAFSSQAVATKKALFETITGHKGRGSKPIAKGNISRMNRAQLDEINHQLKNVEQSQWFSVQGREAIRNKKIATFKARGYSMSDDSLVMLGNLMDNPVLQQLQESRILGSLQLVEWAEDINYSQRILDALDLMCDQDTCYIIANAYDEVDKLEFVAHHIDDPNFIYVQNTFPNWRNMSYDELEQITELQEKFDAGTLTDKEEETWIDYIKEYS